MGDEGIRSIEKENIEIKNNGKLKSGTRFTKQKRNYPLLRKLKGVGYQHEINGGGKSQSLPLSKSLDFSTSWVFYITKRKRSETLAKNSLNIPCSQFKVLVDKFILSSLMSV